ALLAAGGVIVAVDAVLEGRVNNAYALVRPPGHHAEASWGRGFCIFGNAVIAILHAMSEHGIRRVATVDWDVHHGNGTQKAFYRNSKVLTISVHQDRNYPKNSGFLDESGEAEGEGYNVNVPLPPGSGREAYLAAFRRVVAPALRKFKPELIVVPSGFDGCAYDPLGRMMVSSETFRKMAEMVKGLAEELCDGRLVLCHEGGYSVAYVPFCGLAVLEALSGKASGVSDPYLAAIESMGGHELYPHQQAVIEQAESLVAKIR
ncbi:MAG: class II histone deacetylase, partial [Gammaproteobacteria bacterium]|nr:class II histone deacetylase [Gammaproteobacteria bacterium]